MCGKTLAIELLMLLFACGCATEQVHRHTTATSGPAGSHQVAAVESHSRLPHSSEVPAESQIKEVSAIPSQLVAHQEEVSPPYGHMGLHEPADESTPLSLKELEEMAMANNPTLAQSSSQVQAERGAAYQAGLPFNPVMGYTSEQIGVNGTAGEMQGGFVAQEIVTGGKLQLSRAKWAQRAQIAETNLMAQQQRVLNDVRSQYYRTLAAQRLLEIHRLLVANGRDNLQTHREMLNLGQTSASAVLQADVELRRDQLNLRDAENELQHAWRTLVALAGVPQLAQKKLQGTLNSVDRPLDWEIALDQLLTCSPELTAARQKIRHDEIMVERERAEPIPNIQLDARVGRNFESNDTTAGVNIGLPIPLFDQNRGTIQQAQADLAQAHAEVRRLRLDLQTRLATEYQTYCSSWQRLEEYQKAMLPKAQEAHRLLEDSYKERRAPWVDVLAAERMYLDLDVEYTENLRTYREADTSIRGMLLSGGLIEPAATLSGGHTDATPKPR